MTSSVHVDRPSTMRVWWLALRPATLTAAVGPVFVGSAVAVSHGVFAAGPAWAALVGAMLIQIATNLFNDWADFEKGADTDQRLGPARASQMGWLAAKHVLVGGVVASGLAALVGVYLIAVAGWPIVVIGVASLACAFLYTAGPYPLGYHGLGDVFVLLFFGFVAVAGTYYVQAGTVSVDALWAGAAVGLPATAILVVNNLRDRVTDGAAGKRTLVARFGDRFGRVEYVALVLGAYLVLLGPVATGGAVGWLAPAITLPLAIARIRAVWRASGKELNPELGRTAKWGLLFSVVLGLGVMW